MSDVSGAKPGAAEKKAICGICPAGCRVVVTCDAAGRLDRVRADESSPLGMICRLGEHSKEIVYSPDRVRYPLRRVKAKGEGGFSAFERIGWDEAYGIITEKLREIKKESGPEAAAIYTGRGSFELAMCDLYQPKGVAVSSASSVLFPFGSPNTLGVGALCYVSFAMIAPHVTMGGMFFNMFSDIENAEVVVVWGANPATDCPPLDLERITAASKRGAEVVVIDPRRTMTAKLTGAEWVPVRPGTDGALALAMCNVLISEELYDERFAAEWTHGFEEFAGYVQHFRPESVAVTTGVPADTIRRLARKIAQAGGASPVMYSGLEYSDSGVQAIRAVFTLWALAGQLDVPGGRCFTMKENHFPINRSGHVANPDVARALGRDRFPVYSAYRGESHAIALPESVLEGRPYRIRSLIVLGGSIITAWPEPEVWKDTLGALDFLVTIDRHLTADAAYADIVLPATTMYEISSYMVYGPAFHLREKVIEPVGEARSDFFILSELAERLGYGHLYPRTEEELLGHALAGSGFTLDDVRTAGGVVQVDSKIMEYRKWEKGLLREDGRPGFSTPTGKFEIASTVLEEHGYDALPVYIEPGEGPLAQPALARDYPLVFNSGSRVTTDFRSQHHGIPSLLKERPEPTVTMNSADAAARSIEDGERVRLRTPRGAVEMRALVTDDIMGGVIDANMGGGGPVGPEAWQKCNINALTDLTRYDAISGFPVYKALLCEVEKLGAGAGEKVRIGTGEYGGERVDNTPAAASARRIYLDHNATTAPDPEVVTVMDRHLDPSYGNPSSIYSEGRDARAAVEGARRSVARMINSTARRVIFTGGGSEANNLAVKGVAFANLAGKRHIITSTVEHPSVGRTCRWLEGFGIRVTRLGVDSTGLVDPDDLRAAIDDSTCLVTIMTANNETGVIQPIAELARIARERGVLFHTDAVQAAGKVAVDVEAAGVDLLTLSGHKFHGPKGVGVLYVAKGVEMEWLVHGGGQENGARAGTENVPAIAGLGKAAGLAVKRLPEMERVGRLRDRLEEEVLALAPGARVNGHAERRLPNTLSVTLPGVRGEPVVLELDRKGVALSSGSACRSGSPEPSHALTAMGLTDEEAHCAL
ncbi:MAG: aminotransferase class V-fold PLP-dependent enzyme, partial [Thermodesulfobacteriota bacterium]